jgi:YgiT-type zinc finger domain-containing protein
MKCVVCHGRDIEVKEVVEEISIGKDIVLFPVKTLVCMTCGERYYDRRTMQFLEQAEKRIVAAGVRLTEVGKVFFYEEPTGLVVGGRKG